MSKDFDDFDGLSENEIVEAQKQVAEQLGIASEGDTTSIPMELLPIYLTPIESVFDEEDASQVSRVGELVSALAISLVLRVKTLCGSAIERRAATASSAVSA